MNYKLAAKKMIEGMPNYVKPQQLDHGIGLCHAVWMLYKIMDEEMSVGKANRWLGYAQATFAFYFVYTLDELKEINRRASCDDPRCKYYNMPHIHDEEEFS